jgi:hypothetical protein
VSTTANQAHKQITQRRATEAALQKEFLTRQRVDLIESKFRTLEGLVMTINRYQEPTRGGIFNRLRWLFTGK